MMYPSLNKSVSSPVRSRPSVSSPVRQVTDLSIPLTYLDDLRLDPTNPDTMHVRVGIAEPAGVSHICPMGTTYQRPELLRGAKEYD